MNFENGELVKCIEVPLNVQYHNHPGLEILVGDYFRYFTSSHDPFCFWPCDRLGGALSETDCYRKYPYLKKAHRTKLNLAPMDCFERVGVIELAYLKTLKAGESKKVQKRGRQNGRTKV